MRCPSCGNLESKVVDSRPSEDGTAIRRRRECLDCGRRFTTYERLGENPLIVIKMGPQRPMTARSSCAACSSPAGSGLSRPSR